MCPGWNLLLSRFLSASAQRLNITQVCVCVCFTFLPNTTQHINTISNIPPPPRRSVVIPLGTWCNLKTYMVVSPGFRLQLLQELFSPHEGATARPSREIISPSVAAMQTPTVGLLAPQNQLKE